jgi:glycerol-3-phosphate acyltransferase PlsY
MDAQAIEIALLYLGAFLAGSIPTSYAVGRLVKEIDIRGYGSGNVGASNVFEHIGKKWAVPVGLFDGLVKGAAPVCIALYLLDWDRASPLLIGPPLLAIAANNWSPWLGLQGGRGLSVACGALLVLSPVLLAAGVFIGVGGWVVFKASGMWVLISLALLPVWAFLSPDGLIVPDGLVMVWFTLGLLVLVVLKRLSSNWAPLPKDIPRRRVFLNRLVRDRDLDDRAEWVRRMPGAAG